MKKETLKQVCLLMLLSLATAASVFSQERRTQPAAPVQPQRPQVIAELFTASVKRQDTELSIPASPEVNVNFCISEGSLTVNGWNRNEIRLFIKDGLPAELHALKNNAAGQPDLVVAKSTNKNLPNVQLRSDCISGKMIEMDMPLGAALKIEGRSVHIVIDSIKKVNIKNISGNISLKNIAGESSATTHQGNIVIENSFGPTSLITTIGNIVAVDVSSEKPGELFRARTNSGSIALKSISHYQLETNTISGSVVFDGKFLNGGIYNFRTSNGPIRLNIPESSSLMLNAIYGFGKFDITIPIKIIHQNSPGQTGRVVGTLGDGAAEVSLLTNSGTIGINKQQ